MNCRICGNTADNKKYLVSEMMFGTREEFLYFQCSQCQCLQIAQVPADLSRYYPPEYYAFVHSPVEMFSNPVQRWLKNRRNHYAVFDQGLLGRWLYNNYPRVSLRSLKSVLDPRVKSRRGRDPAAAGPEDDKRRFLDVGCGAGALLYSLRELGFKNLLGVDPYIDKTIRYQNGLAVRKQELKAVKGKWDIIMFHHCLEHVGDQQSAVIQAARLLCATGTIIVRIPTVTSLAWQKYKTHWVQLDAPRHLYLHSHKSIRLLAQQHGLLVDSIICDSDSFQFWGSEQYKKGIALMGKQSYLNNKKLFSSQQMSEWQHQAEELNKKLKGDQIVVYLKSGSRSCRVRCE